MSRRVRINDRSNSRPVYHRSSYIDHEAPKHERARRITRLLAVSFAAVILTAGLTFIYFYNHYSTIVKDRVESGFWHSRGGVYAAPKKIRVGDSVSATSIVDALGRAGYIEGESPDGIFNGSFTVTGNSIEIKSLPNLGSGYGTAVITLKGNKIAQIKAAGVKVDEYLIESEMLIGRTASKRSQSRVLNFDDIPVNLRNAILAAEDRRFFSHYGIDPQGILRAFYRNVSELEIRQGGSTITQQLVKNTFLSPERSFTRKIAEAFLSLALENQLSKEEIFALYCNEIYLGQYGSVGVHGVDQAAKVYFGKDLASLNLAESAAIAAMIKNPNRFGPHKDADAARMRREATVSKMAQEGMIRPEDAEIAKNLPLVLIDERKEASTIAPYFVDAATSEIADKFDGDYLNANFNTRIYTTIDTHLQKLAEAAVAEQMAKLDRVYAKKGKRLEATLVALDPHTGHVLAMVGGRDYSESQFNRATSAWRQPGSTFKPFVYATALERGYTPISTFSDEPMEFMHTSVKPYKPSNFREGYSMTNLTLKTALAKSSNVIAVQTAMAVGLDKVAKKAEKFGFQKTHAYPSLALGATEVTPLQLAAAYASFANGGRRVTPVFVDRIVSGSERTIYEFVPTDEQIISEQTAYMITDMLEAVVERGTARSANNALGKNVVFAGKTGSSKDGWFVGYTPNIVTVAWIGFDDNSDVRSTGGEIALPLWTHFMAAVVKSRPEFGGSRFAMPNGLTEVVVDPETGMLADSFCPQSERVVLPRLAASNIKCIVHQPRPEVLLAESVATDYEGTVTDIPATLESDPEEEIQIDVRPYVDQFDEAPPRPRPVPDSTNKPKPPRDTGPSEDEDDVARRDRLRVDGG
ncbi:MAG TPA: PBP1A family penicillin-binding protein [Pyrinomonadaceae bacterium]